MMTQLDDSGPQKLLMRFQNDHMSRFTMHALENPVEINQDKNLTKETLK